MEMPAACGGACGEARAELSASQVNKLSTTSIELHIFSIIFYSHFIIIDYWEGFFSIVTNEHHSILKENVIIINANELMIAN